MIRLLLHRSGFTNGLASLAKSPSALFSNNQLRIRPFSSGSANISQPAPAPATNFTSSLAKDVIVYKYENPRFFKLMNIFAVSQFLFWGYLGHWSFTSLRDAAVSEEVKNNDDLSWWRKVNLGESKYKTMIATVCVVVAYVVIFVTWTFTLKSVRYLVALKNGKDVSIVTYTPFGKNRILNVPIKCISAQESRSTANVYLPLKVKNTSFFYILDMKGEFKNTRLFDQSIGLSRKL